MSIKVIIIVALALIFGLREFLIHLKKSMWENMAKDAGFDNVEFFRFLYNNFGKITTCENQMELNSSFFMLKIENLVKDKILKKEDSFLVAPPEMINKIITDAGYSTDKNAVSFCVMSPNGQSKYAELYYNFTLSKEYEFTEVFQIPTVPSTEKNILYKKTEL